MPEYAIVYETNLGTHIPEIADMCTSIDGHMDDFGYPVKVSIWQPVSEQVVTSSREFTREEVNKLQEIVNGEIEKTFPDGSVRATVRRQSSSQPSNQPRQ